MSGVTREDITKNEYIRCVEKLHRLWGNWDKWVRNCFDQVMIRNNARVMKILMKLTKKLGKIRGGRPKKSRIGKKYGLIWG